jgi:hypothetical protein
MTDTPVFQGHHVIEQGAYARSPLLQALSEQQLFDLHNPRNLLNLPADQALAAKLNLSPHPGGPLGGYSDGLQLQLRRLQQSPDGQATLRGDRAAAERVAAKVGELTDTLKTGMVNGDLYSNTPQGMTRDQANKHIREFFGNLDEYRQTHSAQIAEIGKMRAQEAVWAGVTRSEGKVAATLDAIDQPNMKPMARDPAAGRRSLGGAVAQANEFGRLPLSESLEVRLRAAFPSEMPPSLVRAPGMSTSPGMGRTIGAGAAVLGAALTVADGVESANRASTLYDMNNATGARSELIHFGARNVGAWGGALLGAGFGASVSSPTGPGAVIGGIVGGAVGLVGGTKIAEYLDHRSIYRQEHPKGTGTFYTFKPDQPELGWRRTATIDLIGVNGQPYEQSQEVVASGFLAAILDRQATTVSLDLMLARPPVPKDPYTLPSAPGDAHSMPPSDWHRDPATGQWKRPLYEWQADASELGSTTLRDIAIADPARAAQLDAASQAILRDNVHLAPAAMAARYELAYHDKGWKSVQQELPDSAKQALADDGRLVASDGAEYRLRSDGGWERQALFGLTTADANPAIRTELDATRALLQEGLREHRALMAERPEPVPPSPEQRMTGLVVEAYREHGLTLPEADIKVMALAMLREQSARGINDSYILNLERDSVTRQYSPDSPMGFYTRDSDGDMSPCFTMTPAQAKELLAAPDQTRSQSMPPGIPSQPASLPPDFAPSLSQGRDLRDPVHVGHEAFKEVCHRVRLDEVRNGVTPGPHSDCRAAATLQLAVENGVNASDIFFKHDKQAAKSWMLDRGNPHQSENKCPRFAMNLREMSSQPIEVSSQRVNEVMSKHYDSTEQTQALAQTPRAQEQAQALEALNPQGQIAFARLRGELPAHVSDSIVGKALTTCGAEGLFNAAQINSVVLIGDEIQVRGLGDYGKTLRVNLNDPAPSLQESVTTTNTLQQQHALAQQQSLAQKQDGPDKDDPGPKGPKLS